MKKLIAIIIALCAISGYPMDVVSEVVSIFAECDATAYEKTVAIEVVTEDLENLYGLTESNKSPTVGAESTKWWVWDLFVSGGVTSSP